MSIEEKFFAAVEVIENLPSDGTFQPSEDLMLKLSAYYMQATQGPCKISKPSIWHYSSRIKWNAWNDLGNMDKEVAMEKYVEELTKVIETMSYNENVSKFMSLIGPFYEVVSSDESDVQSAKSSHKKNPSEYCYPVKNLEELCISSNVVHSSRSSANKAAKSFFPNNSSMKTKNQNNFEDGKRKCTPSQSVIDIFKSKTNLKHQPFVSQQDMLILTIINLQNSLLEIVEKMDNLQSVAKAADFNFEEKKEEQTSTQWNLGFNETVLALLWPIALNLCT